MSHIKLFLLMMKLVRSRKKETSIFSPQCTHFFFFSLPSLPTKPYEVTENLNIIQIGSNYYDSYYPSATSPKSDQDLIVSGSEQTQKKKLIPAPKVLCVVDIIIELAR